MYSEVEIVNLALGILGKTAIRDFSLTDTDPITGRLSQRIYQFSRDRLIAMHDWTFARWSAELNQKDEDHPEGVVYALPSDCYVPRRLGPRAGAANTWTLESRNIIVPFSQVSSVGAKPILRYTRSITNTSMFMPYFVAALSAYIAAKLAMPLTKDADVAKMAMSEYKFEFDQARLIDSNIGNGDDHITQDLVYDTFITGEEWFQAFYDGRG